MTSVKANWFHVEFWQQNPVLLKQRPRIAGKFGTYIPWACTKSFSVVQYKHLSLRWMKLVTWCDWLHQQSMKEKASIGLIRSFFARMARNTFEQRINQEIFDRIMPHLQRERCHGYEFESSEDMRAITELSDPKRLLAQIEQHIQNMPTGYGEAFHHILHCDLATRLSKYEKLARRWVRRPCDPKFIATRAQF
jgi:hypothetical protein